MVDSRLPHGTTPSWLPLLLKCHAAMDRSVSLARKRRFAEQGANLACGSDCPQCCKQPIPASIPEMAGAMWRLRTVCDRHVQHVVLSALTACDLGQCPFLVERRCSVYPLRFLACRGYGVFASPCRPGEDPFLTRPGDLLRPDPEAKLRAFALLARLLGHDLGDNPERNTLRRIVMRSSPPVQFWDCSHPDIFVHLMDKGPPLPECNAPGYSYPDEPIRLDPNSREESPS